MKSESGVSELIGAILLVSLVVILMMVVTTVVLSQPRPGNSPEVSAAISLTNLSGTSSPNYIVTITHTGGDTLKSGEYSVVINGKDRTPTNPPELSIISPTLNVTLDKPTDLPPFNVALYYKGLSSSVLISKAVLDEGTMGPSPTVSPTASPTISPTATATATATATSPVPPVADFIGSPLTGNTQLSVQFNDISTNNPTSWSWEYKTGMGSWTPFSTARNPNQVFATGVYDIRLTATNAGGSDQEVKVNYITVVPICTPPTANFQYSQSSFTTPLTIQFTDQSTGTPPLTYSWNFGDGSSLSSIQSPSHPYANPGNYPVNLTITNACGQNSKISTVNVQQTYPSGSKIDYNKPMTSCPNTGYLVDGTYIQFETNKKSDIRIGGITKNIDKDQTVRITIHGNQDVGEISVSSNKDLTITGFDVILSINGIVDSTGVASDANVQIKASTKLFSATTLTYTLNDRCMTDTDLIINSNTIINGQNNNEIRIENMNNFDLSPTEFLVRLIPTGTGANNNIKCTGDIIIN